MALLRRYAKCSDNAAAPVDAAVLPGHIAEIRL